MEVGLLLDPIVAVSDIISLIKLSQINSYFYHTITVTKFKEIIVTFDVECDTLKQLYIHYFVKQAYNSHDYKSHISLLIRYDSCYLLDEMIKRRETEPPHKNGYRTYTTEDTIVEEIILPLTEQALEQKKNNIIDYMVRNELCHHSYDGSSSIGEIYFHYLKTNNIEMMQILLNYGRDSDGKAYIENVTDECPYSGCCSVGMYLLLKENGIEFISNGRDDETTHTDIYDNLVSEYNPIDETCMNATIDYVIKYGSDIEKDILVCASLYMEKIEDNRVLRLIYGDNELSRYRLTKDVDRILDQYNRYGKIDSLQENYLRNLCEHGYDGDKLTLLKRCNGDDKNIKLVLDYMFEYGDGRRYLGRDYIYKGKDKSKILKDLINGIVKTR